MSIVDWFRNLWKVEEVEQEPNFLEEEAKAAAQIGAQYQEVIENDLTSAFDVLKEDEDELEKINAEPAPNYDVGEISVDDLLSEESAESYYGANTVDAKIEGSDTHLKGVAILGDIPITVEENVSEKAVKPKDFSKLKKAELVEQEFIYRGVKYISTKQPTQPQEGIYRGIQWVA